MNSLNDPIINLPDMGEVAMNDLDLDSLSHEQIETIIRLAPSNPNVLQNLLNRPEGESNVLREIRNACQKSASVRPTSANKRVKKGDRPSRSEALNLMRMVNRKANDDYKGVFFHHNGKIKSIPVNTADKDFFQKNLGTAIEYDLLDGDLIIAYSTVGRRPHKLIMKYLEKYELDYSDKIKRSAIIYSAGRDVTVDDL